MKIIVIESCMKCPYCGGFGWCGKLKISRDYDRKKIATDESYLDPNCPLGDYDKEFEKAYSRGITDSQIDAGN